MKSSVILLSILSICYAVTNVALVNVTKAYSFGWRPYPIFSEIALAILIYISVGYAAHKAFPSRKVYIVAPTAWMIITSLLFIIDYGRGYDLASYVNQNLCFLSSLSEFILKDKFRIFGRLGEISIQIVLVFFYNYAITRLSFYLSKRFLDVE